MGLHVSVMLALAAVVHGAPLPTKNLTLSNDNSTETAAAWQVGIQRGWFLFTGGETHWLVQDQWTTMSGSAITTKCRECDGGDGGARRAWELYQSPGSNKFDMLRNVHTNLCLDAYWSFGATKPFVHGYPCDVQNGNQHWDFDLSADYGWIRHRRHNEWILYGYDSDMVHIKDPRAAEEAAHFTFAP